MDLGFATATTIIIGGTSTFFGEVWPLLIFGGALALGFGLADRIIDTFKSSIDNQSNDGKP